MDIRVLDRGDDALVGELYGVTLRSQAASRVRPVRRSATEFRRWIQFEWPGERNHLAVAVLDGSAVGYALATYPDRDNVEKTYTEVHVDPGHRRRGVGSALVSWVEQDAVDESRSLVLNEVYVPVGERESHPGRAFALGRGYSVASIEVTRLLELPLAESVLAAHESESTAAMGADYEVAVYSGGVPDALRQGVCDAQNRVILDSPSGDIDFEADTTTPEDYQKRLDFQASIGMTMLTAVAIHRTTGKVAAYTDIGIPSGDPEATFQWGTLVQPEHRGHRLGMAVKVANLRELGRVAPARTSIRTMNDEQNKWMVQINEDLGFEIIEEALFVKKEL